MTAGTRIDAGHSVAPEQFEPGRPDAEQARAHLVTISLFDATMRADYGLTDGFALAVRVPVRAIDVVADFTGAGGQPLPDYRSIHHRDEVISGLADVSIDGVWWLESPWLEGRFWFGLSLPTGNIEADPFVLGAMGKRHQHIFLGTGTVDPRMGLTLAHDFGDWAIRLTSDVTGAVYRNREDYQAGWRISETLAAPVRLGPVIVRPELGLFVETPARWASTTAVNSGRVDLVPGVGVAVPWTRWVFGARVARPINLSVEGGQLQIPLIVGVSVASTLRLAD